MFVLIASNIWSYPATRDVRLKYDHIDGKCTNSINKALIKPKIFYGNLGFKFVNFVSEIKQ